jgi:O-6-methylguanine DNA methyltransferase
MSVHTTDLSNKKCPPFRKTLKASCLDTQLGSMVAIADEAGLYRLEFLDKRDFKCEIERIQLSTMALITLGITGPISSIICELKSYFDGTGTQFKTPVHFLGTHFQRLAWDELRRTPYGETRSYRAQAEAIGKNKAYRAVANANGANQLAIVVPCHRIICSDGSLGGYRAGVMRKQWLINHEKKRMTHVSGHEDKLKNRN